MAKSQKLENFSSSQHFRNSSLMLKLFENNMIKKEENVISNRTDKRIP